MIVFKKERFDAYCSRFPEQFRIEALAVATVKDDSILISDNAMLSLRSRFSLVNKRRANFGLGDAVAAIANPIARAMDATLGTKIEGCGGCARRREALNQILPNLGKSPKSEGQ